MSKSQTAMALVFVSVIVWMVWDVVGDPLYNRHLYRGEVVALYRELEPGTAKQQVRVAMDAGKYPHLEFHQPAAGRWSASAPLEFGARNWVLLIEFQDDYVSAVQIRTADGDHDHPAKAPADKVRPLGG